MSGADTNEADPAFDAALTETTAPERGRDLIGYFQQNRWNLLIGSALTSPAIVAITWPLADHASMLWFLFAHQAAILAMAVTLALPVSDDQGTVAAPTLLGIVLAQLIMSSAIFFDPEAARDASFAFGVGIVLYAFAAGALAVIGPLRQVTRLTLACGFGPYVVGTAAAGHPGIALGSVLFLAVIAGVAVDKTSRLYDELTHLRHEAAVRAEQAEAVAETDALTGLTNRYGLEQLDGQLMQKEIFGIFIDLDKFKAVNDTLGHQAGDLVLQETAKRIRRYVRPSDTIARLGGDEFFILLWSDSVIPVMDIADRIRRAVDQPISIDGDIADVSASIGVSRQAPGVLRLDALIAEADEALYMAKSLGRNQVIASSVRLNEARKHAN